MSKVLINVIPQEGVSAPSLAPFSDAFKAFYKRDDIKKLFDLLLDEGDITLTFNHEMSAEKIMWNGDTREILLPREALIAPTRNWFDSIAKLLIMMVEQNRLTKHIDTFLNNLQVDYTGLDEKKIAQVKKLFQLLTNTKTFSQLNHIVTKDEPLAIKFVQAQEIPAGMTAHFLKNNRIVMRKDATLLDMFDALIRAMLGKKVTDQIDGLGYEKYPNESTYANAIMTGAYEVRNCAAFVIVALMNEPNAEQLISHLLAKDPEDPALIAHVRFTKQAYENEANLTLESFLEQRKQAIAELKANYLTWRQNTARQIEATTQSRTSRPLPATPLTTSFQHYRQAQDACPKVEEDSIAQAIKASVMQYKQYACSDAKSYSGNIYPGKEDEIIQRYMNKPVHHLVFEAQANSAASPHPITGRYSAQALAKIATLVDKAKSGCCTTFAISMAHKLISQFPDLEIQMVSSPIQGYTAHCFLMVNTGKQILVVDPWLAALGWEGMFTQQAYPFKSYLGNPTVVFDSKFDEDNKMNYKNCL